MIIDDVKEIILNLNCSHYYKGPESDNDVTKEGDVWFFLYPYEGLEIYIKIRLELNVEVVCLSFHKEGEY